MGEIRIAGTIKDEGGGNESVLVKGLKELPDDYISIIGWNCPKASSAYSEIDAIVICPRGIVVLEAKNWKGRIIGNAKEWEWTGQRGAHRAKSPIESLTNRRYALANYMSDQLYDKPKLYDENRKIMKVWLNQAVVLLNDSADISKIQDDRKKTDVKRIGEITASYFESFYKQPWALTLDPTDIELIADRIFKPLKIPILGIDFGTTNSLVAYYNDLGSIDLLHADEEGALVPTLFAWTRSSTIVGKAVEAELEIIEDLRIKQAITPAMVRPGNIVVWIKKLIGRTYSSYKKDLGDFPYKVSPGTDDTIQLGAGKQECTPEDVATEVLKSLKKMAEQRLGDRLACVVPVPVRFNERQKMALEKALYQAGFQESYLSIDEATAAALAWLHETKYDYNGTVAIYDLGGGTFDVSIVQIQHGVTNVKAVRGDDTLGGFHFDLAVIEHQRKVSQNFAKWYEKANQTARYLLRRDVEKIRKRLSKTTSVPFIYAHGKDHLALTRPALKKATVHLVNRTLDICREAIDAAKRNGAGEVDQIILSGGMTYTPFIQEAVKECFFGKESKKQPYLPANPSTLVARGATVYAGMLMGRIKTARVGERVTPFSYGINSCRDYDTDKNVYMSVIIERDQKLFDRNGQPQAFEGGQYVTVSDNQKSFNITMLQSYITKEVKKLASDCTPLGSFDIEFAPFPKGQNGIHITFKIDKNGILEVEYYEIMNPTNRGLKRFSMLLSGEESALAKAN